MKAKITFLVGWALLYTAIEAQTVFWQDNFELAGAADIAAGSTRTAENNSGTGGPPFTSYFCRTPATGTVSQNTAFTGFTNTNYWAGEDHDGPFGVGNEEQQIEWTNINITGKTAITFRGFLAANNTNGPWDNGSVTGGSDPAGPTGSNDYIIIESAIDAGAYTRLYLFVGDGVTPAPPGKTFREDANSDGIGEGTQLTNVFAEFIRSIPGTGTTMKLRIRTRCNGSSEEWGIDNFRLFATTLPVTWSHFDLAEDAENVHLTWGTTSEVSNDYFAVERSIDGVSFAEIGRVDADENAATGMEYAFSDASPAVGKNYYRIRQVDLNGEFMISEALEANVADPVAFELFPNPVKESLNIRLNQDLEGIQILNLSGAEVDASAQVDGGSATIDVSSLADGMYFAKITHKGGFAMRRFVVQR